MRTTSIPPSGFQGSGNQISKTVVYDAVQFDTSLLISLCNFLPRDICTFFFRQNRLGVTMCRKVRFIHANFGLGPTAEFEAGTATTLWDVEFGVRNPGRCKRFIFRKKIV